MCCVLYISGLINEGFSLIKVVKRMPPKITSNKYQFEGRLKS